MDQAGKNALLYKRSGFAGLDIFRQFLSETQMYIL
jgi:hypothetical protein